MATQSPIEISLIDANLKRLDNLKLPSETIYLNIHCNQVEKIENLSHLAELKYLDLSSNQIRRITGLSGCRSLQTLNLSCNSITKIEGLDSLKNLKSLNVSYNQISDISGFKAISKKTHSLSHVQLQGNKLSSLKHIIQCLCQSNCIHNLSLQSGNDRNPVCEIPAYRPNVLSQLPWLESLDGSDKYGNIVDEAISMHDIPGLDEFIALLEPSSTKSNNSISSSEVFLNDIFTPKIDSLQSKFAQNNDTDELEEKIKSPDSKENDPVSVADTNHVSERLESLENKLGSLVQLFVDNMPAKEKEKNEELMTRNDGDDNGLYMDSESSSKETCSSSGKFVEEQSKEMKTFAGKKVFQRKSGLSNVKEKKSIPLDLAVDGKRSKLCNKTTEKGPSKFIRTTADDETYLALLNEMDAERERRWKAEQASRKLVENIRILQEKLIEECKIQEAAISSSSKSKKALDLERQARHKYEELTIKLEDDNSAMKVKLEELLNEKEVNKRSIEELISTNQKLEKEKFEEGLFNEKRYKELQLDTGGCFRELELLKNTVNKQKDQISQLQELLISREQEQKDILAKMVSVDSKEVRKMINHEVNKTEEKNAELIKHHMQRLIEVKNEYAALEDEFRTGLQIEANRYNELYSSYERTFEELNVLKTTFENTCQKEAKSRTLVLELSALVKEQKARITEISNSKSDMQLQYKERLDQLDKEVSNLRNTSSKVESLQQDKDRMAAHIRGQESVIQGLRSERKLWGQELAQQGASLAQEKGKIDIQLESQRNEIIHLKNQLKDNLDSLKIKCKLIEDQTETIKMTKQELNTLCEENKVLKKDAMKEREVIEDELEQAKDLNQELQESVEALTDRKEELKSKLTLVEEELKQSKNKLRTLNGQWEERSKIIDQFEEKVVRMKNAFDEEKKKLNEEKKLCMENFSALQEKWNSFQVQHKSEIAAMKHNFNLELKKMSVEKEDEIQKSKEQVMLVEEEMRLLLNETSNQKKNLETRISQLSKAFSEIQRDLT